MRPCLMSALCMSCVSLSGNSASRISCKRCVLELLEILTDRAIDCFVHYEGKRADDVSAGRFAVRQLIAQAVRICHLT